MIAFFRRLFLGAAFAAPTLTACAATPIVPPAKMDASLAPAPAKATAVFAGGCFWGTQSVFERVKGVLKTTAGYAGGSAATATYDQVTTENHRACRVSRGGL